MDLKNARNTVKTIGLGDLTDNLRPSVAPLSSSSEATTMAEENNSLHTGRSSPFTRPGPTRSSYVIDEKPDMTGRKKTSEYVMDKHAPPLTSDAVGEAKSDQQSRAENEGASGSSSSVATVSGAPEDASEGGASSSLSSLSITSSSSSSVDGVVPPILAPPPSLKELGARLQQLGFQASLALNQVALIAKSATSPEERRVATLVSNRASGAVMALFFAANTAVDCQIPDAAAAAAAAEPSSGDNNPRPPPNTPSQREGAASHESGPITSSSSVAAVSGAPEGASEGEPTSSLTTTSSSSSSSSAAANDSDASVDDVAPLDELTATLLQLATQTACAIHKATLVAQAASTPEERAAACAAAKAGAAGLSSLLDAASKTIPVAAAAAAAAEPSSGYNNPRSSPITPSQREGAASHESGPIASPSSVAADSGTPEGSSGGDSSSLSSRTTTSSSSSAAANNSDSSVDASTDPAPVSSPHETAQPIPDREMRRANSALRAVRPAFDLLGEALADAEAAEDPVESARASSALVATAAVVFDLAKIAGAPNARTVAASHTINNTSRFSNCVIKNVIMPSQNTIGASETGSMTINLHSSRHLAVPAPSESRHEASATENPERL